MFGQSTIIDGGCSCIRLLIKNKNESNAKNLITSGSNGLYYVSNMKMVFVDEYYGIDEETRKIAMITVRGIAHHSIHPFTEIWELKDAFDSYELITKETFIQFKRNAENLIKYI